MGGLGRSEPAPYSDLDLVLLHNGKVSGLDALADAIWYPIWDSGIGLDHSVRTVDEAVRVAKDDLKAVLGLLDARHVAGDGGLWGPLRARVLDVWRTTAAKRSGELHELSKARWATSGEAAFLLEPNLKDSHGGLRDAQTLHALAAAQFVDFSAPVRAAYPVLLDVRGELHRIVGRPDDVLHLQEHDGVAAALGVLDEDGGPDRDTLLRSVNEAARTVAYALDLAWRRIEADRARSRRPAPAGCSARRHRSGPNASGWPRTSSPRTARWCSPATPSHAPMWDSPCAPRGPRPRTACRWASSPSSGWPRRRRRCPSRGRPACSMTSCPSWAPGCRPCRCWNRSTMPACSPGCCPSGMPCAARRSTTRYTASPSTGTCSRPPRRPPGSPGRSTAPTCCCSEHCCTTSARVTRATTLSSARCMPSGSHGAWGLAPMTPSRSPRSCAIICCCRTRRRAVTSTTR